MPTIDPQSPGSAAETLSETELEVLRLLATGATNREIARTRGISEATVKKHVTNINLKLGTGNRTEAVRQAIETGLVTVPTPGSAEGSDGAEVAEHRAAAEALAVELEQAHRRHRRMVRTLAVVGTVALVAVVALSWAWLGNPGLFRPTPTPPPTALPATPIPPIWKPGKNLPSPRTGLALVVEPGSTGAVLAIAGAGAGGVLSETLRYDPRKFDWEPRAAKPSAVRDVAAVALQGKVVVPGGCGADGRALDVTEIYDIAADTWSAGPPLPRPVCGYGLAEVDGRIYLFGGRSSMTGGPERHAWSLQLGDAAWSDAPEDLPLPRSDAVAVAVHEQNEIHLLGGSDGSGPQANHWLFRPFSATGQWQTEGGAPLPEGRAGLGGTIGVNARREPALYVISGGWDRDVDPWALALDGPLWEPAPSLRLALPQRGAPLVTVITPDGLWLVTAGGETDERLLEQYSYLELAINTKVYMPIR